METLPTWSKKKKNKRPAATVKVLAALQQCGAKLTAGRSLSGRDGMPGKAAPAPPRAPTKLNYD